MTAGVTGGTVKAWDVLVWTEGLGREVRRVILIPC